MSARRDLARCMVSPDRPLRIVQRVKRRQVLVDRHQPATTEPRAPSPRLESNRPRQCFGGSKQLAIPAQRIEDTIARAPYDAPQGLNRARDACCHGALSHTNAPIAYLDLYPRHRQLAVFALSACLPSEAGRGVSSRQAVLLAARRRVLIRFCLRFKTLRAGIGSAPPYRAA